MAGDAVKARMSRHKASESQDFDDLVRMHYGMVVSFLASLLGDRGAAEDLAQEVFIVAWKKWEQFDAALPPGPWLRGIARNLARNAVRKVQPLVFLTESALEWLEGIYSGKGSSSRELWTEKLAALEECIARMGEKDARYIEMRYDERLSYKEISSSQQTSLANVKKRLYRIRRRLAECVLKRLEVTNA